MLAGFNADPAFLVAFAAVLLGTGLVAGVLAGLLGVGGGIVIVPVLFNLFPLLGIDEGVRMHLAVGTSLATIIPTSIMSMRAHHKRGGVDWDLLKSWAVAIAVGVIVGTIVGARAKGWVLTAVFGTVAIVVSINMAFRKEGMTVSDHLPTGLAKQAIAAVIGLFSVMMGIGGGTLTVPILSAFNYPIRRAVGTASAIGLIIAVPGTIGFIASGIGEAGLPPFSLGYANIVGFALIVPATMVSAPWGAKIAHAIKPEWLRKAFALFLFVTAARMFWSLLR